jgi:signal transduction histidine kinase
MHDLVVNLSRAQTLRSLAKSVAYYCGKSLCSRAGMIFVECDGDLQLLSQWQSRGLAMKDLDHSLILKGPVARAFRSGEPLIWQLQQRMPRSRVTRSLWRLLRRSGGKSISFLPISAPGQKPVGVLAIVLQGDPELVLQSDLLRLGHIVAGCVGRARAYDAAITARVRAENATRRKDEFISILSHELKNPMMPILNWASALSKGTVPAGKQNQAINAIVRNVRELNYLIEDLFDAARIRSGKLRLQPGQMRIQNVAQEALTTVQQTAESKNLRITSEISAAIPPFTGDARRLRQVLVNLLNNAVKFTPEGGGVNLVVRRRGDKAECIVSDTGQGIERKFLPFVFDRFQQEDRPSTVRAGGLGLGLGIAREIVDLHDGSIKAFSEGPGKGSTFVLRLPIRAHCGGPV